MFPAYPLIALCSATGIDAIQVLWFRYIIGRGFHYAKCTVKIALAVLLVYSAFGVSRMLALYKGIVSQKRIHKFFAPYNNHEIKFLKKITFINYETKEKNFAPSQIASTLYSRKSVSTICNIFEADKLLFHTYFLLAYHAPMDTFIELARIDETITGKSEINLCMGKEWHRFPSSFFLPDR